MHAQTRTHARTHKRFGVECIGGRRTTIIKQSSIDALFNDNNNRLVGSSVTGCNVHEIVVQLYFNRPCRCGCQAEVHKQYFQNKKKRKTQHVWPDVVRPSRCNAFAIVRFLVFISVFLVVEVLTCAFLKHTMYERLKQKLKLHICHG